MSEVEQRKRIVGYRFRAYPTPEQAATLERWQHAQRALWNTANAQRMERLRRPYGYDQRGKRRWLSAYDQHAELTECRQEFEWLRDVPVMFQQHLLTQLDRAWNRFLGGSGGLPRFKKKSGEAHVPLTQVAKESRRISRKRIRFPRVGDIRVRGHRPILGRPLQISITSDAGRWFVSMACELVEQLPTGLADSSVGLDLGVTNVVADSNGRLTTNALHLDAARKRIDKAQRLVARRKPKRGNAGGKNYHKALQNLVLSYCKVRQRRANTLHVLSNHYAKNHGTVVIEDLRVSAMSKSAKGTKEKPGTRVRQKSGLNRSMLEIGWYELRRQLTYKCERSGAKLIVIAPRGTSQQCSVCGVVDANSRRSQAKFVCVACGHAEHADVNAAKNILARGIGHAGATTAAVCGGLAVRRPLKQKETSVSGLETNSAVTVE